MNITSRFNHSIKNTLLTCMVFFIACQGEDISSNNGYEIYCVENAEAKLLNRRFDEIQLPDTPMISMNDIASYEWEKHMISLTSDARKRINGVIGVNILSYSGRTFVVSLNRKPIYGGYFWSTFDSRAYVAMGSINTQSLKGGIFEIPCVPIYDDSINYFEIYDFLKSHNKIYE